MQFHPQFIYECNSERIIKIIPYTQKVIVSYRIGVEDEGFRLYILFLIITKALYCINYLLLSLLRFLVPAISHS